jgi:hypothetical protein
MSRARANETGSSAEPVKEELGQTIADHAGTIRGEGPCPGSFGQFRGGRSRYDGVEVVGLKQISISGDGGLL